MKKEARRIDLKSYGKINLSLDVLGHMEGGFHEVEMVMQAIRLHDDVSVMWRPGEALGENGVDIRLKTDLPYVPDDERNIAYKAADLMAEKFPQNKRGDEEGTIDIKIHKRIPVAAGLAGGSGNGAAVILALDKLWELNLSMDELLKLGAEIGSDVPFSMMTMAACIGSLGKKGNKMAATCALAKGRGTELEPLPALKSQVVLAKPPMSVSTKEVYRGIDDCHIPTHPDNRELLRGIRENNRNLISANMINVLENYTLNRYDKVKAIKNKIVRIAGQDAIVLMTGSGPTVFALTDNMEVAKKIVDGTKEDGVQTFITRTLI